MRSFIKSLIVYTVLFAFNFIALTPTGVNLSVLHADDLEIDELDVGLDDEEDYKEKDELEEDLGDDLGGEKDSLDNLDSLDEPLNEPLDEPLLDDKPMAQDDNDFRKKIVALYLYTDSFSQKSAGNVVAETASMLGISREYNYLKTESELFIPSMSVAKRDYKRGLEEFEEAKQLYNDLSIEEAIAKFKSAKKTVEKHLDKLADMKILGDILLYLGASYKMLDEESQATPYFSSYLSIYPNAELDDVVFSPEIVSFFNGIKEDFLMLPNGSIKFDSYPSGALVFLNGKVVGVTPTTVHGVTEGRHFYRIHKTGYRDRGDTVQVRERRTANVSEDLSKYEKTSYIENAERDMTKGFGHLSMLRKAVDVAKEINVDYILVTLITADAGKIRYEGRLVNAENRSFKEADATFEIFDPKDLASIPELQDFNRKLIDDTKGFRPISDVALDEADILGVGDIDKDKDKDKDKKSKPVYKQWWLWTILGVVVLGGAGVGTYFLVKDMDKDSGASLEVNF